MHKTMKKLLLSLVALLGVMNANAQVTETDLSGYDYAFYNTETTVLAGSEVAIPIYMKNAKTVASFQVQVTLPEGIEFKKTNELNADRYDASSDSYMGTVFGGNPQPDGSTMVIGTVLEDKGFKAGDDIIGYITISVPEDFAAGEYPIVYKKANFSGIDNGQTPDKIINEEITSKLVIMSTLVLDENSEELPLFQDGMSANVSVNRTIKAGQWSTIIFPFNISSSNASKIFGSDASYVTFSGYDLEVDDDLAPTGITVNFATKTLNALNPLTAGTPYLVKTTKDITSFELTNVKLASALKDVSVNPTFGGETLDSFTGTFKGSLVKTTVPEDALFITDNKFYYSTGKTNIKGFRAWFELDGVIGKPMISEVKMRIDGDPTSISDIDFVAAPEGIFTIDGKKMNNDVTKLPKGVYIIDGKKVAIK